MLRRHRRVVVDVSHLDVADHQQVHRQFLVYLIYREMMMVHHQCVVENLHQLLDHLLKVVLHLDALQILDELNLDEIPPFLDEELPFPQVAAVDVGPPHQLKMDCYRDEVGVEPPNLN
jgi:hypothetical protein